MLRISSITYGAYQARPELLLKVSTALAICLLHVAKALVQRAELYFRLLEPTLLFRP